MAGISRDGAGLDAGNDVPLDEWPWDWDFRRNCRVGEIRGSIPHLGSSQSILSDCLSEVSRVHEDRSSAFERMAILSMRSRSRSPSLVAPQSTWALMPPPSVSSSGPYATDTLGSSQPVPLAGQKRKRRDEDTWESHLTSEVVQFGEEAGSALRNGDGEDLPDGAEWIGMVPTLSASISSAHIVLGTPITLHDEDIGSLPSISIAGDRPSKPFNRGSAASRKSENLVTCQICQGFKGRPSEVKKHAKRHERPYGCTFSHCGKAFGSKDDWKRHESTQHPHAFETWRCDENILDNGRLRVCANIFPRRGLFRTHLRSSHNIRGIEPLNSKVAGCQIPSQIGGKFWCGFCRRLINLTSDATETSTERFNHIDDHFMKDGKRIESWMPVDQGGPVLASQPLPTYGIWPPPSRSSRDYGLSTHDSQAYHMLEPANIMASSQPMKLETPRKRRHRSSESRFMIDREAPKGEVSNSEALYYRIESSQTLSRYVTSDNEDVWSTMAQPRESNKRRISEGESFAGDKVMMELDELTKGSSRSSIGKAEPRRKTRREAKRSV